MFTDSPDHIHPSLWRASQLASSTTACINSTFPSLSKELPGGGWPRGSLNELLLKQYGSAELRLLQPALAQLLQSDERTIVLIRPPHQPQLLALHAYGIPLKQCLWIHCKRPGDALWAAEQVLRSGSCAALLIWQTHIRNEALRRLHLAAQSGDTVFFMMRPSTCAEMPSPAPLRLHLTPVIDGIQIQFIKRRGVQREQPLLLALPSLFSHLPISPVEALNETSMDRTTSAFVAARSISPELAHYS
ncbi:translesion DNA synthesis-associated protein ImuA [Undibacterium sp. Rencai35W]|uniref:translesion DNA synthesis-associated protein ImuA n=1 Tax=Undibacterium sp. Rencai35W TaxID=3413046 RepID=UPI003BF3BD77